MEQLSTEEESSDSGGEGGSDDELARNLETLLGGRKTTRQLTHEQEELERQELRKLLDKPVSQYSSSWEGYWPSLLPCSWDRVKQMSQETPLVEVGSRCLTNACDEMVVSFFSHTSRC